jgi:hypothetical protein
MATVKFTNNRNFDLHLWVYDRNANTWAWDGKLEKNGGYSDVPVQGEGNAVHYHWGVMEIRNDEKQAFHGAHFEHNPDPVVFSNPNPALVPLPSMFRPFR